MASSVDGLVSGLNTTQMISQLMQVESQGQQRLQTKVQTVQTAQRALQSVNGRVATLRSAAHALTQNDTWNIAKATSSSDAVTASAASGASAGTLTFDVTHLASARVALAKVPDSGPIVDAGGMQLSVGGAQPVDLGLTANSTAQDVANAINAKGMGVLAALVNTDQGSFIQLAATKTGTTNTFSVTGLVPSLTDLQAAADATIQVGDPLHGGYTVTSASNTFTGVMTGVTFTASRLQTGVTLSMSSDVGGIADKVQAMVTAANAALTEIGTQTSYDATNKKAGPLLSDLTVQTVRQNILSAVAGGDDQYGSFKQFGVQLDSSGKLAFNRDTFLSAYQADPAKAKAAMSSLATKADDLAAGASNSTTGMITLSIQNRDTEVRGLNQQISNWGVRLQSRQEALQKQFASLEVALGKMKDQSNWLSGQLAAL